MLGFNQKGSYARALPSDVRKGRTTMKGKRLCLLAMLGLLSAAGMSVASAPWGARPQTQALAKHASTDIPEATRERDLVAYGKLPLSFEANRGQTDEQVRFLSRGSGYSLFLTSSEAVLVLSKPATHGARKGFLIAHRTDEARAAGPQRAVLRMKLVGAGPTRQVEGLEPLPGKVNYFIGNDPKEWHTNVPTYARVAYRDVYPGIDLLYYGTQRQLEYDFIVAPGVDPRSISLPSTVPRKSNSMARVNCCCTQPEASSGCTSHWCIRK